MPLYINPNEMANNRAHTEFRIVGAGHTDEVEEFDREKE